MSDHKYGCLMAVIPANLSRQLNNWIHRSIDPDHLAPEGYTDEPHVTVKHGFVDGSPEQAESLVELLSDSGPFSITIGGISFFKGNEDGDVLKLDISSETLHKLNSLVSRAFKCRDKYPDYKPHLTLAYLDPKFSKQYESLKCPCAGLDITIGELVYSAPDKTRTRISLMSNVGDRGSKSDKPVQKPSREDLRLEREQIERDQDEDLRRHAAAGGGGFGNEPIKNRERAHHESIYRDHGVLSGEDTNSYEQAFIRRLRLERQERDMEGEEQNKQLHRQGSKAAPQYQSPSAPRDMKDRMDATNAAWQKVRDEADAQRRQQYERFSNYTDQVEELLSDEKSADQPWAYEELDKVDRVLDRETDDADNEYRFMPGDYREARDKRDARMAQIEEARQQYHQGGTKAINPHTGKPDKVEATIDNYLADHQSEYDELEEDREHWNYDIDRLDDDLARQGEIVSNMVNAHQARRDYRGEGLPGTRKKSTDNQPLQPNPNRMSMDEQHNWVYDHFGDKLDEYDDSDPETRKEAIEAHQLVGEHRAEQDYLNNRDQKYLIRPSPFIGRKRLVPPCIKSNHQHDINAMLSHIRDTGDHDALLPLSDAMEEQGHQDKAEAARKLHRHGYLQGASFPHQPYASTGDERNYVHEDTPENRRRSAYDYLADKPIEEGKLVSGWYQKKPYTAGIHAGIVKDSHFTGHKVKYGEGSSEYSRFLLPDSGGDVHSHEIHHHAEGFNRHMDEQERNQQNNKRLTLSHTKSHDEDMTENLDRSRSPRPHKDKPPDILEDMAAQGPAQNSEDYYDSLAELYEQQREQRRFRQEKSIRSGSIDSRNRVKALRRLYGSKTLSSTNVDCKANGYEEAEASNRADGVRRNPIEKGKHPRAYRGNFGPRTIRMLESGQGGNLLTAEEVEQMQGRLPYQDEASFPEEGLNRKTLSSTNVNLGGALVAPPAQGRIVKLKRNSKSAKLDELTSVEDQIGRHIARRLGERQDDAQQYVNENEVTPEQVQGIEAARGHFNRRDHSLGRDAGYRAYRDIYPGVIAEKPSTPDEREDYERNRARAITQQVTSRSDKEKQKFPDALDYVNMAIPKKPGAKSMGDPTRDREHLLNALGQGDHTAIHGLHDWHQDNPGHEQEQDVADLRDYVNTDREKVSGESDYFHQGHSPEERQSNRARSAHGHLTGRKLNVGDLHASPYKGEENDSGIVRNYRKPGGLLSESYEVSYGDDSKLYGYIPKESIHHATHHLNQLKEKRKQEGQKALGRKSIVFPRVAPSPFARQKATGPEEWGNEIRDVHHYNIPEELIDEPRTRERQGRRFLEKGKTEGAYRSQQGHSGHQQYLDNEALADSPVSVDYQLPLEVEYRMEHRRGTKATQSGPETFRREWRQGKRPEREYHERPVHNEQGEEVGIAYTHTEKGKSPESYRETIRQNS